MRLPCGVERLRCQSDNPGMSVGKHEEMGYNHT